MGIRFLCPNGHKLNVKTFLAGKKAVCPKCGEKVLVPTQSQLTASSADAADEPEMAAGEPSAVPLSPSVAAQAPVATAPVTSAPAPVLQPQAAHSQAVQPQAVQPQAVQPQTSQPYAAAVDPIAEAPQAVWYVRPPSGGQFGPAAAEVMRGWLGEGRVTADSLVWRSDWADWRSASATFPQLSAPIGSVVLPQMGMAPAVLPQMSAPMMNGPMMGSPVQVMPGAVSPIMVGQSPMMAPTMPAGIPMGPVMAGPSYIEPAADYTDPLARTRKRRQKGADTTMIVSGILVALVVLLFIVLGVVLSQNSEEPEPARSKPKPRPAAAKAEKPKKPAAKPAEVQPLDGEGSGMKPEFDDKELELPPLPGE